VAPEKSQRPRKSADFSKLILGNLIITTASKSYSL
jgi:hypothetical protein